MRLFDELLAILLACDELDFRPFLLIVACLPLYRVAHQLEELLFEVVVRSSAQPRVLLDIRDETARLLKAKHPVNINQPHAVLEIESQVEVVHHVHALWQ